ncbi:MAG TPA: YbjQ family protein [Planosporangium sp.]|nr:YbjQ family protein [Planosporangium sp.]
MLVVTTESLPGYEIRAVLGEVLGVTACTRNPYVAGFRTLDGGQGAQMAQVLVQSRASAISQMINAARSRGATAVIGMRFDNRDITGNWVELCAYGTAVLALPITDEARRQQAATAEADEQAAPG